MDEQAFADSLTNLMAVALEAADRRQCEERFARVFDDAPLGMGLVARTGGSCG
jgi:hypothetical protein